VHFNPKKESKNVQDKSIYVFVAMEFIAVKGIRDLKSKKGKNTLKRARHIHKRKGLEN
jgi:hypothetical protein